MSETPPIDSSDDAVEESTAPAHAAEKSSRAWIYAVTAVVVVLAILGGVLAFRGGSSDATDATTTTVNGTAVTPDRWPITFKGLPAGLKSPTEAGFFVWYDGFGFHVRGINPTGTTAFNGKIFSNFPIPKGAGKAFPADSGTTFEIAGNSLSFSFEAKNVAVGFDFNLGASTQLSLSVNDGKVAFPIGSIHTGAKASAVGNPVVFARG